MALAMATIHRGYAFGPFRLDTDARVLWRDGEVVPLPPRAVDVLEALLERRDDVVMKDELMGRVWPHAVVEEANLSVNVSLVRRALGTQADGRPWIETVPRRGYRLLASAEVVGANEGLRSLAVLPFQRLGPAVEDDFLGAALADALITRLGRHRRLRVRPTATALRFAERDPEEAGRAMAVDGVLTGSLQQAGRRLRVTAQLVPLSEGVEPWAGAFEEDLTSLFAMEDALAAQLARALGLEKDASSAAAGPATPAPASLEAHQSYMKGRYFWSRLTGSSLARAFACFQEAAEKDPSYGPPHSGLADGHLLAGLVGLVPPLQAWDLAEAEATAALACDAGLAEAHVSLAYLRLFRDWDFAGAEAGLERARELSPRSVAVLQWLAVLLHLRGRPDEAAAAIAAARQLDPASVVVLAIEGLRHTLARDAEAGIAQYASVIDLDPHQSVGHWGLGLSLTYAGRHQEAVASLRHAAELAGGLVPLRAALGWGLATAGQLEQTRAVLRELERPEGGEWTSPYQRAILHTALGETGRALACLEEACAARDAWVVWLDGRPDARSPPVGSPLRGRGGAVAAERPKLRPIARRDRPLPARQDPGNRSSGAGWPEWGISHMRSQPDRRGFMSTLHPLDWAIVVVYFAAVLGIAWWSTTRGETRETSAGYFLAGRHAGWFVIGASLFASNIGSEHLVGLAGTGAASGVAVGHFEVRPRWILLLLGWVFVPFYLRSGVFTMPEFLERRYSPAARWYLALISIVGYVLTKISVTIAAGGIVFETLMGIDFWTGALVVVVATGLYTVFGGLRAVLYTDFMQIFVLFAGSLSVTLFGLQELGGWGEMRAVGGQLLHEHVEAGHRPRLPLDRHPLRRAHPGRVVLVHRPVHRAARALGARTSTTRGAGRSSAAFSSSCRCSSS